MPASVRPGWGVLVAVGDKAKAAEHFDRSLDRKADVSAAVLTGGDLDLCTTKTIVGRLLMNAEGSARAASQVADILIDVPSGASAFAPAPQNSTQSPRAPDPTRLLAPPFSFPSS